MTGIGFNAQTQRRAGSMPPIGKRCKKCKKNIAPRVYWDELKQKYCNACIDKIRNAEAEAITIRKRKNDFDLSQELS